MLAVYMHTYPLIALQEHRFVYLRGAYLHSHHYPEPTVLPHHA